ncbi:PAS domain S-box protein [Rubripirellula tenax]|nr:PAS domain S-box protein [Rubripirellula tenax]
MRNPSRTYWLPSVIVVAFVAVAVFGIITYVNTLSIRESEDKVAQSFAIREATSQLLSAMTDAETGQRGFLLTGDVEFLIPYHDGVAKAEARFSELNVLADGNGELIENVKRLRASFEKQHAHLQETIEMRRREPSLRVTDEVLDLVKSGRGRIAMDGARSVAETIVANQTKVLKATQTHANYLSNLSQTTITAGHVLALSLIVAAGLAARHDRKKRDAAEVALLAEQSELAAVIDSAFEGIVTRDQSFRIRLINPAAARILGVKVEHTVGRSLLDFVPSNRHDGVRTFADDFQSSSEQMFEFNNHVMVRSDGTEFAVSGNSVRTKTATDDLVTVKFRDISDLKDSQAKRREYAAILEQIEDAVLVCELDGRVRSCNDSAEKLFGHTESEMIGLRAAELLSAEDEVWQQDSETMMQTGRSTSQRSWVSPQGREYVLEQRRSLIRDDEGVPVGKLLFLIDITDRIREEANERRNQRLESIGTLTGGIAHDLNNVLTPIVMSAKLLRRGSKSPERLVDNIITSADRGGRMIKKLLAFAGGSDGVRSRVDIGEVLSELQEILCHTLQQTIDVHVKVPANLRNIDGDSTELSQVIMNLAVNARDAMPDGGRLEIEAENFDVDESHANRTIGLTAGPHVLLTVADSGHGIPKEIIERIFDPFFTTKAQGKGTGLGLATTLGIIRSCGGDIQVFSELGAGTKFSIYLPSSKQSTEIADSERDDTVKAGDGETILIVDDERLILETAKETLEANQYQVLVAGSGTEGIAIYTSHGGKIDLVLLDMMMPGMDGIETKDAIRRLNASAQIIASSGLRRPAQEGGKMDDFNGFLAKPYNDEQLLRLVQSVLHQPSKP